MKVLLAILTTTCIATGASVDLPPAFVAGMEGSHTYRIPSIVVAHDGSLVVAAEARRTTWVDKSPTDVVVRRSTHDLIGWEVMSCPMPGNGVAMMDPCLVTGPHASRIILLAVRWPAQDGDDRNDTVAYQSDSNDDGRTWSSPAPARIGGLPKDARIQGLGPGSGFLTPDGAIIVPTRLAGAGWTRNCALRSVDDGKSWNALGLGSAGGEFQIAPNPDGSWVALRRAGSRRAQCESRDGGATWTQERVRDELGTLESGCEGSLLAAGNVLLHAAPAGADATPGHDNRGRLTLYRSTDKGVTWGEILLLHASASGYSSLARMTDGRVAVAWESGEPPTFIRSRERPPGWMRIDVRILPADIADPSKPLGKSR